MWIFFKLNCEYVSVYESDWHHKCVMNFVDCRYANTISNYQLTFVCEIFSRWTFNWIGQICHKILPIFVDCFFFVEFNLSTYIYTGRDWIRKIFLFEIIKWPTPKWNNYQVQLILLYRTMVSAMNHLTFIVFINCIIGITNGRSAVPSRQSQALRFEQCREGCLQKVTIPLLFYCNTVEHLKDSLNVFRLIF